VLRPLDQRVSVFLSSSASVILGADFMVSSSSKDKTRHQRAKFPNFKALH
jgi:hypothetical protein